MKSFGPVQHILSVLVMILLGVIIGLAIVPAYLFFEWFTIFTEGDEEVIETLGICVGLGLGYIIWGVSLVLICGSLGGLFKISKPEGRYPLRSLITIQWAFSLIFHRVAQIFLKNIFSFFLAKNNYSLIGARYRKGCS